MRRLLTVVPAVFLLAACGVPEATTAAVPAAVAAPAPGGSTTAPTARPTSTPRSEPLGIEPVDMGPAPARPAPRAVVPVAATRAADLSDAPPPKARPQQRPSRQPAAQPTARPQHTARQQPAAQEPPAAAQASGCNANYTPCVPEDPTDVDCEGGSGNGPSYVTGPVTVVGDDVYGLDADHDDLGCE
jgi:hypothetical protein